MMTMVGISSCEGTARLASINMPRLMAKVKHIPITMRMMGLSGAGGGSRRGDGGFAAVLLLFQFSFEFW